MQYDAAVHDGASMFAVHATSQAPSTSEQSLTPVHSAVVRSEQLFEHVASCGFHWHRGPLHVDWNGVAEHGCVHVFCTHSQPAAAFEVHVAVVVPVQFFVAHEPAT